MIRARPNHLEYQIKEESKIMAEVREKKYSKG